MALLVCAGYCRERKQAAGSLAHMGRCPPRRRFSEHPGNRLYGLDACTESSDGLPVLA